MHATCEECRQLSYFLVVIVQSFYSVHGEDALFIARQYYRTTAVVKHLGAGGAEKGLASVTLNRNLFESVLRDLLLEGADHTVELWDGSGSSWKVVRCDSAGRMPCRTHGNAVTAKHGARWCIPQSQPCACMR